MKWLQALPTMILHLRLELREKAVHVRDRYDHLSSATTAQCSVGRPTLSDSVDYISICIECVVPADHVCICRQQPTAICLGEYISFT